MEARDKLIGLLADTTHDPYKFVMSFFPWGEGELLGYEKPDPWQEKVLRMVGEGLISTESAIKIAVASGNGIGKSCLVSWLIMWAMATKPDTRCVVTANTDSQLKTKTMAELAKWHRLFIMKEMFVYTATSMYSSTKDHERTWRIDAIPWSKENPEAFAGLHNQGRRILIVFDEASAIYDEIWRVTEGAITDANTEIIWAAFGNPTRINGAFYDCFRNKGVWKCMQVDSRTVAISNKETIEGWEKTYGEDSDFFRVHVKGEFPKAGDNQLISLDTAQEAYDRQIAKSQYDKAPIIIGVDPAWTGSDMCAIVLRQGLYSKVLSTIPKNDNDMDVARRIATLQDEYRATAVFIDQGYGTGIYSYGKDLGRRDWRIVPFAGKPDREEYANKRAEMWFNMKSWLMEGGSISDRRLIDELVSPEAFINRTGRYQLESKDDMKRRGVKSPNIADALALTFAFPVKVGMNASFRKARKNGKIRKAGAM